MVLRARTKNTAQMLEAAMKGAQEAGAEVEMIHLYGLNYKGCMSCFLCKRKGNTANGLCGFKDELRHRSMRPSELHKALPEATPRVLDIQLKELVDDGLVIKTIYPELPPRSEYSISELGMSLIPIIDAMLAWGEQHMEVFEKKYKK